MAPEDAYARDGDDATMWTSRTTQIIMFTNMEMHHISRVKL